MLCGRFLYADTTGDTGDDDWLFEHTDEVETGDSSEDDRLEAGEEKEFESVAGVCSEHIETESADVGCSEDKRAFCGSMSAGTSSANGGNAACACTSCVCCAPVM